MQTVELIDQTAKVLRLLQRELHDCIDLTEAGGLDQRVVKCRAASDAIDAIDVFVPALREACSTQESQDLLGPSLPCPDYDAF